MPQRDTVTGLVFLLILGLGFAAIAHGQFEATDPLTLTVTPMYPRPYQNVTIIPGSSAFDLAASTVTATVNGSVVSQGSGSEPVYVTVGGAGSATNVTVRASSSGKTYTKSIVFRPADVALVLEPATTAHPLYEGGVLVAPEGRVRLIAIPDLRTSPGTVIPAANLIYTWRNGEQILQAESGIGKSVLNATSPFLYRDSRITVTVATQDRSVVAESAVVVSPASPLVRVYRNDPLLGPMFGTALPREFTLSDTEESFRAVPYFFGQQPSFSWSVNNVPSDSDRDITVRATGQGSGAALLSVLAKSTTIPQSASASLSVRFGESRILDLFGF